MLAQLYIQNYAIIDELTLKLGAHFNVITGETGAGKSILTGALGLILGNRAEAKILYEPDKKCIVEAIFTSVNDEVVDYLNDEEIDIEDGEVIIRRIISPNGKSRAFINDIPVTLLKLRKLNNFLIDMHRQFDTLGINTEETQTSMLDAVAGNNQLLKKYKSKYSEYRKYVKEFDELQERENEIEKELDFLQFQYQELNELNFEEGEQENLENDLELLKNADAILILLQKVHFYIEERTGSINEELTELIQELTSFSDMDNNLSELNDRLSSTKEELTDIANTANILTDQYQGGSSNIEEMQERLDDLYRILRKHHKNDLNELLIFQEELRQQVSKLESFSQDKSNLEKKIKDYKKALLSLASDISASRKKVGSKMAIEVKSLLAQLGMEHAQFIIDIKKSKDLTSSGNDSVTFLFNANPGKNPEPIKNVASGGELSRLALSLKTVVADNFKLPTLLFDEIDAGISGEVAGKMGSMLANLSKKHQLISISHSPQIAAQADSHFFVYKRVENNRTYTQVKKLDEPERIIEIAKMLSGDPPPDSAIENAKMLMNIQ